MKRLLTGLKPTGDLTLGNYIGAIDQVIKYQDEYDTYLFVADLHAITIPQEKDLLNKRIKRFIAMYIACGINPNKCTIYLQSENPYIPAISWILECNTYYGEASRMIQFKEKTKENKNFSVGLLTYPTLMAADILYCDSEIIPVGIDQKQHVELARNIAERFNNKYGKTFNIPEALITSGGMKIKDLKDPSKKMSKSEESPQGVISLFDDPEDVRKKILKATTDSYNDINYDMEKQPGISNLINIASFISKRSVEEIVSDFKGKGYGEFKTYVADITSNMIKDLQDKYNKLVDSKEIDKILDEGLEKTKKLAKEKYEDMKIKMGLYR